ncbi:MAG: hypothetical protein KAW17_11785 [Candidatus Eisenbacteria sp.]|nr:hypothetical protein [Candidatus Eisenbacteria bacterium]
MNVRMVIVVGFIASAVCLVPSVWAQQSQFSMDYWGFTHEESGVLSGLGFIPLIEPPLVVDLENYQYTWVIEDAVLDSSRVDGGIEYYYYSGGTFKVYEDTVEPWNAVYSDADCQDPEWVGSISEPWTFQDGELFLLAEFQYLNRTYYTDYQFGDYEGMMDLTGGTHLDDIPPLLRHGWTFGGATDQPWACIPEDYEYRWDGQLFLVEDPTRTESTTWSGIKSFYR